MFTVFSQSWRSWNNAKGLAALAVIALAVGIGCATAIFTVVNAVLLAPLPYTEGDRWVILFGGSKLISGTEQGGISSISFADLEDYRDRTHSFDVFGWYMIFSDFNLTAPGEPQHIQGTPIAPSLIDNVGVSPIHGRLFRDSDGPNVAVISSRLWTRLGAGIIGRSITLDGEPYTVLGVMPPWFALPVTGVSSENVHTDVWIPLKVPRDEQTRRRHSPYAGYARLKPGVTIAQAQAECKRVASEIAKEDPRNHEQSYTAQVFSLREFVIKQIRPVLLLLFSAAGLLLLITCANVAGLLVARSVGRVREIAVRVALGGGQGQLALQFFFESLFVAIGAAVLGVAASVVLVRLILTLAADFIPRADQISTNWPVALFAVAVGCLAALLSSLAPLWQAVRTQPNEVLNEGVRSSAGARSRKLSYSLVVAEIALAFTLLSISALLLSQLEQLHRVWPGFDPNHLVTFQLSVPRGINAKESFVYENRLLRALEAIPGVSSAAVANQIPLEGCCIQTTLFPEGRALSSDFDHSVAFVPISAEYFQTMRIPLEKGRFLSAHDTNENPVSVVIDQATAKRLWPDRDPIGAFARVSAPDGDRVQVIGVAGNVRNEALGAATRPELYVSSALTLMDPMHFVVRSDLPASSLIPAIRRAVREADTTQPIYNVHTMKEVESESLTFQRIDSTIVGFFACAALLMAALGVYGVTSYSVRQRTVEMGTRMALGATGRDLLQLILGSGLQMAGWGLGFGALAVICATWLVARFFQLHDIGALPYVWSVTVVTTLAILASLFPAWRATLLSPMVAIRNDGRRYESLVYRPSEDDSPAAFEPVMLTEFVDVSRRADSFSEALRMALATLRTKIRAQSAMLLEDISGREYACVARVPESQALACSIPADGFLLNRLKFFPAPLAFTPGDLESSLRWATEQKPRHVTEIDLLKELDLRLAVALRTKTEILGLLLLGPATDREAFSSSQKQLLAACADQFALMIENARLTERVVEQEKLRRDVALAAEVQRRLLPRESPETGASSLAAFTLPVRSVGGDYYDFLNVGDQRIGVALADVAGKGVAAALIMAVVHASLRVLASEGNISLSELATKMNRFLHGSTGSSSYATFFYAQIDEQNRQLHYVNAGHNPPYLVRSPEDTSGNRSDRAIEELKTGGTIIGMFPSANYEEATIDLRSGDVLLAFTDGVTEALNANEEEFGEERLKNLVQRLTHLPVQEMTARIAQDIRTWIGDAPQHDDITFVVMKVN
jgi:predicted permease